MNSQKVLFSKGRNDECYTLQYGVKPILKYIPEGKIIWCPFDTEESEFTPYINLQNSFIDIVMNGSFEDWSSGNVSDEVGDGHGRAPKGQSNRKGSQRGRPSRNV